jgi:hypothetical protein
VDTEDLRDLEEDTAGAAHHFLEAGLIHIAAEFVE